MVVTKFFDEIMVLYNLMGNRQDIDICTDDDASRANFVLLMESEDDAKTLYSRMNNNIFSVYGTKYLISMNISGASITTVISKALSS